MASAEHQNLATAKTILSAVGSVAATVMVVRGVSQDLLPAEFQDYLFSAVRNFFTRFSNQFTLVIDQFDGLVNNEIYEAAVTYLGPKVSPRTRRLKISKLEKEKHLNVTMEQGEEVVDMYNGEIFRWVMTCRKGETINFHDRRGMASSSSRSEIRSFALTFHKKNRELAINSYLPYITKEAQIEKQKKRTIKIFTLDINHFDLSNMWNPVTLDHPATFETLAMDSEQKRMILNDLDQFIGRKEYYRKVGKAWKRGYLLYGPPGTGKSSLVAAIANYLNFDIYDLELTALRHNTDLRRLLVATANKSILIVEDIDCTIDLQDKLARRGTTSGSYDHQEDITKVTLSGLLNFVDGLWSSCGDERIIIFTTNHIEKLDPALLRPGRMDVHINLSYCTPCGFKLLASNYLGIVDHVMFEEIEGLIQIAKVTPAEVAEQLLQNDNPDVSLTGLIGFMHKKIKENDEAEKIKAEAAKKLKAEAAENLKAEVAEKLKAKAAETPKAEAADKLKAEAT